MKISQVFAALELLIKKGKRQPVVPFLRGKPGIGKSHIVAQLAKKLNFYLIDIRLSQHDSCDVKGNPHVDEKANLTRWIPAEFLPFVGIKRFEDLIKEKGYDGIILLLDEFNRARPDVLQSVFQLVYDRQVGDYTLMDNVYIIAAGNQGLEDGCDVVDMDVALKNRFIIMDVKHDLDGWVDWAEKHDIHDDIIGFIKTHPSYLYYEMNRGEREFITPRTWEAFNKIIMNNENMDIISILDVLGSSILNGAVPYFRDYLITLKEISAKDVLEKYPKYERKLKMIKEEDRARIHMMNNEIIKQLLDYEFDKNNEIDFDWEVDKSGGYGLKGCSEHVTTVFNNFYRYMKDCVFEDNYFGLIKHLSEKSKLLANVYLNIHKGEEKYIENLLDNATKNPPKDEDKDK